MSIQIQGDQKVLSAALPLLIDWCLDFHTRYWNIANTIAKAKTIAMHSTVHHQVRIRL